MFSAVLACSKRSNIALNGMVCGGKWKYSLLPWLEFTEHTMVTLVSKHQLQSKTRARVGETITVRPV
jgi:hypothetical protein